MIGMPPQTLAYFALNRPGEQIARLLGRREHSTVLFACRKVAKAIAEDRRTRQVVEELRRRLQSPSSR